MKQDALANAPTPAVRLVSLEPADGTVRRGRSVVLTCEERARTRYRATLSDGAVAVVMLPRGSVVRPGMRLVAADGEAVRVVAASERVLRVDARPDSADPAFDLLRAAYHLGNRHVPVELGAGFLKLERDPVLHDLLLRLGMVVTTAFEPFDPESGAYGGGHRHAGDDDRSGIDGSGIDAGEADAGTIGEALSRDAHAAARP